MKAGKHASENSGNNVEEDDSSYQKAYAKWSREVLEPALEKYPERREEFVTTSSQKVERLYTSLDTSDIDLKMIFLFLGSFLTLEAFIQRCTEEDYGL